MTQAMSQQIASMKLRFHSIISIQTWKWLLHVESSLSLFLSHLNINLSSQPSTCSIKWPLPCKKNWSNSSLLSYFIFISFSLYIKWPLPWKNFISKLIEGKLFFFTILGVICLFLEEKIFFEVMAWDFIYCLEIFCRLLIEPLQTHAMYGNI